MVAHLARVAVWLPRTDRGGHLIDLLGLLRPILATQSRVLAAADGSFPPIADVRVLVRPVALGLGGLVGRWVVAELHHLTGSPVWDRQLCSAAHPFAFTGPDKQRLACGRTRKLVEFVRRTEPPRVIRIERRLDHIEGLDLAAPIRRIIAGIGRHWPCTSGKHHLLFNLVHDCTMRISCRGAGSKQEDQANGAEGSRTRHRT